MTTDSANDSDLLENQITQSPACLFTTFDSDALEGHVISKPYTQRHAMAEKWETTRESQKIATRQQSVTSTRDTSSDETSSDDGKTRVSSNARTRKTDQKSSSDSSDNSMEDFSDSLVELVKIIKKQRGESDSSDFEMEMENIVTRTNSHQKEEGRSKNTPTLLKTAKIPRGSDSQESRPPSANYHPQGQVNNTRLSQQKIQPKSNGTEDCSTTKTKKKLRHPTLHTSLQNRFQTFNYTPTTKQEEQVTLERKTNSLESAG